VAATVGTATIDFGSTPTSEASIVVTGQAAIASGSHVEAWIMGDATGGNDANVHKSLAAVARVVCHTIVAATGFTITVYIVGATGATGTFTLHWVWS
jgi:hypothetical protein